MIKYMGSASM